MKKLINVAKSLSIVAFFVAAATFAGCNAADLTGPEAPPQTENDCPDCSNGRNL